VRQALTVNPDKAALNTGTKESNHEKLANRDLAGRQHFQRTFNPTAERGSLQIRHRLGARRDSGDTLAASMFTKQ